MNKGRSALVWILVALGIVGLSVAAYRAGYLFGSDMAKRDNRAEGN